MCHALPHTDITDHIAVLHSAICKTHQPYSEKLFVLQFKKLSVGVIDAVHRSLSIIAV